MTPANSIATLELLNRHRPTKVVIMRPKAALMALYIRAIISEKCGVCVIGVGFRTNCHVPASVGGRGTIGVFGQ